MILRKMILMWMSGFLGAISGCLIAELLKAIAR